jgi:VPS62-like protein
VRGLLTHRLRWVVFTALVAAAWGWLAFDDPRSTGRVGLAAGAVVAAVAFPITWWRATAPAEQGAWPRRLGRFGVLVALSLLALGGGVVGAAVLLGWAIAGSTKALSVTWLYVGLAVLLGLVWVLAAWWARAFDRVVLLRHDRLRWSVLVGLAAMAGVLAWLDLRPVPGEIDRERRAQLARQAGSGRYDLLLVVDPADRAGRRLIRAARRDLAAGRGDRLFARPPGTVRYDVAYGLAVPEPRRGRDPLWRLIEPPTNDGRELSDSLARVRIRAGAPASASYGRLLADTLVDERVRWRGGAQRGVAFILEDLPSLAQLDRYLARPGDAIPPSADPTTACVRFLAGRASFESIDPPSKPAGWGDALADHCRRRAVYRLWEEEGRPAGARVEPLPPVALHVLTGESRRSRATRWRTWSRALDGGFDRLSLARGRADAERLLLEARGLHTGVPVGDLADLAGAFRPHLLFDAEEGFFPLDVDWLLTRGGVHQVCDRTGRGRDNCEDVSGPLGLVGALDEYIDFAGGGRLGRDLAGGDAGPARMYVHIREVDGKLYLGYWWFFRFNSSPWRPEVNCLPGLSLSGLSCHDHEGDWEGVTVVLDEDRAPEAVVYEAHGRPIRWRWEDVERVADRRRPSAGHPVVYVAAASHASYPAGCRRDECDQRLAGSGLGDGGFDGSVPWPFNDDASCDRDQLAPDATKLGPCLIALPSTRDGELGVLWNAFPGAWGKATCTRVGKVCAQVDGPRSPGSQGRFKNPRSAKDGSIKALKRFRRAYGRPASGERAR